jgi:hypothetical protein
MSKIDCVTVSIGFDDYLSLTLPRMVETFDRVAVVTEAADLATQRVAEGLGAQVVCSTRKQHAGEVFNLPALINDGVRALAPEAWIVKMDPDIFLLRGARAALDGSLHDPELVWGSRRYFCETLADFRRFEQSEDLSRLEPPYEDHDPDVLGFFQLAHAGSRHLDLSGRGTFYEEGRYEGPSRTNDRLLSGRYPPAQRRRTPFDVVHLGLDAIGTNWKGRKAPRFF